MMQGKENLGDKARVRAGILHAHLSWAAKRWPDFVTRLRPHLDAEALALVEHPPQAEAATLLFSELVRIDKALAAAAGGEPEAIYRSLGAHSAQHNLDAVYERFEAERPHEFFASMSFLHRAFQDFGKSRYERLGERSGRIRIASYREYSPVFCASGSGYYEEALRLMKVPGPIEVREVSCRCSGDPACVFEVSW
jgi:predicted hydrocarbon binding protein